MSLRSAIYDAMKKYNSMRNVRSTTSPPNFYTLITFFGEFGFVNFILYCRELISSVIMKGTAVPMTHRMMRVRKALDLPQIKFDNIEVKKIAEAMGLFKISGEGE